MDITEMVVHHLPNPTWRAAPLKQATACQKAISKMPGDENINTLKVGGQFRSG